jgi:hypothetical protein
MGEGISHDGQRERDADGESFGDESDHYGNALDEKYGYRDEPRKRPSKPSSPED